MAGHKVPQKGRAQNAPKGRVRCAPVVQPVPAKEPTPHQERKCRTPGAMAEAGEGGGARSQAASQPVTPDFQRLRPWFAALNFVADTRCLCYTCVDLLLDEKTGC